MHGVVFASLRDYVAAEFGAGTVDRVFAGSPVFLLSDTYPDERFHELLGRVIEESGREPEAVLLAFGRFTARRTFARLYPAFFTIAPSARDFLLTVESRIHELVRATIPRALPPHLLITEDGADSLRIEYSSPRRLCVLLHGLVEGTAAHYGERAEVEETACMHRADEACVFSVRLSGAGSPA
jgi:hypothetical protein